MSKHTPGPWYARDEDGRLPDIYEIGTGSPWNVATVNGNRDEWEANARLIAAAPELLNAVRFLLSNPDNRISAADINAARAAIKKATEEA